MPSHELTVIRDQPVCRDLAALRDVELEWFELKFHAAFLSKRGTAFQDFFADLMDAAYPGDFQRVRPYGNRGDLKCDGLLGSQGLIFQVYAPRDMKLAQLLKKIRADFDGAQQHWIQQMQGWVFVHNDPDGLPAEVVQEVAGLRTLHPNLRIETWTYDHLRDVALRLPRARRVAYFGRPPSRQDFDRLGFVRLAQVLTAIRGPIPTESLSVILPVSPKKLEANALSSSTEEFLKLGRQRECLVQQYLDQHPNPTLGESIATAFREEYARLRTDELGGDQIFLALWEFAGGSSRRETEHEAAVLAVLSYLFERCDIFEAPTEQNQDASL